MAKKLYYKIGEACKILEIQPYVLRYWETEFPFLSPNKSKSGQRVYSDRELDIIRRIKYLLYDECYTIAGAKKKLEGELADDASDGDPAAPKADPKTEPKKVAKRVSGTAGKKTKATSGTDDRSKALRHGVEVALRQAREILEVLQV